MTGLEDTYICRGTDICIRFWNIAV